MKANVVKILVIIAVLALAGTSWAGEWRDGYRRHPGKAWNSFRWDNRPIVRTERHVFVYGPYGIPRTPVIQRRVVQEVEVVHRYVEARPYVVYPRQSGFFLGFGFNDPGSYFAFGSRRY